MNKHLYYLVIDIACLIFPLLFSFHPSIKFYKEWKPLFIALFVTAFVFIVWAEWFTVMGVWSFNSQYLTGYKIGHLPVEEILFFLFIPYCLMFMYHCTAGYFTKIKSYVTITIKGNLLLSGILIIIGIINYHKWYSGVTFTTTGIFLLIISTINYGKQFNWIRFWITYLSGLIPFLIVNGLLTSSPIVLYNDSENLGIRITTIPLDDFVYNLLLFLCNVTLYNKFSKKKPDLSN